jgi:DHA1 family quinolone resistance protein-like MFS transporter
MFRMVCKVITFNKGDRFMNNSIQLRRNRWLLLVARCCAAAFAAGTPSLTTLWTDRGLSRGDFYLLEILFALALVVLEVATGRLADRVGKVFTMRCGFIALAAGSAVYAVSTGFGGFVLGEVVIALGLALVSGTDEAFLFQTTKALKSEKTFQSWWTWSIGASFVSMAAFAVIGASLSVISLSAPYLFCTGFQVVGLLLCFAMVEPPKCQEARAERPGGTMREAVSAILLSSSHIRWMAIAPGFVAGLNQTFLWMYPEYLAECGIGQAQSGYVFALFNLVAGATAMSVREIKDLKSATRVFFVLVLALGGSTLGLVSVVGGLAWLLILPQQMIRSMSGALFSHSINEAIPDSVRATALSVRNSLRVFLYVTAMVPWWLGVDRFGRDAMFGVNLAMLTLGGLILWVTSPLVRANKV